MEVVKNIVFYTTARCFAAWYLSMRSGEDGSLILHSGEKDADGNDVNPVRNALCEALTTSFGSICLGSLFVALFEMIHFVLIQVKMLVQDISCMRFMMCCVDCCA